MSIPQIYQDAEWCCTLPFDESRRRLGVGLNLPDGTVVRFALDEASARSLAATMNDVITRRWLREVKA